MDKPVKKPELPYGVKRVEEATKKALTLHGGQGDGVSALVEGQLLTVKENIALTIARDVCDDAVRREKAGTKLQDIPMIKLIDGLDLRVKGRAVTKGEVIAEIGRLHNLATYGNTVRRR